MDIHAKADQLLDSTQTMLAAAQADDWEQFELQEQQRRTLLEAVFADNQTIEEPANVYLTGVINEIQLLDKIISDLIMQQRDQAAEELRHLKRVRASDKAYRTTIDDSY